MKTPLKPNSVPSMKTSHRTLPTHTADMHAEAPHCHVFCTPCAARPPIPAITYMAFSSSFLPCLYFFILFQIFQALAPPYVRARTALALYSRTIFSIFSALSHSRCTATAHTGTRCLTSNHHYAIRHPGGLSLQHAPLGYFITLFYYTHYFFSAARWTLVQARLCVLSVPFLHL